MVNGAAGAVGSAVGQIAKIKGYRIVGKDQPTAASLFVSLAAYSPLPIHPSTPLPLLSSSSPPPLVLLSLPLLSVVVVWSENSGHVVG